MVWTYIGLSLLVVGGMAKVGINTYRKIKRKEFFTAAARDFYTGGFDPKMSRREAQLILGVREGATPDAIKKAHRQMMTMNHPDAGGSTYVATKINEAKDNLLK